MSAVKVQMLGPDPDRASTPWCPLGRPPTRSRGVDLPEPGGGSGGQKSISEADGAVVNDQIPPAEKCPPPGAFSAGRRLAAYRITRPGTRPVSLLHLRRDRGRLETAAAEAMSE